MQLDQIIIRIAKNQMVLQYSDQASRGNNVVIDVTNNANVASVIADAKQLLPTPQDRPDKPSIEREIAALEARLTALKQSIGESVT